MRGNTNLPEQKQQKRTPAGGGSDLTSKKQGRSSTNEVSDGNGKRLTEEQEILSRWTEYC